MRNVEEKAEEKENGRKKKRLEFAEKRIKER